MSSRKLYRKKLNLRTKSQVASNVNIKAEFKMCEASTPIRVQRNVHKRDKLLQDVAKTVNMETLVTLPSENSITESSSDSDELHISQEISKKASDLVDSLLKSVLQEDSDEDLCVSTESSDYQTKSEIFSPDNIVIQNRILKDHKEHLMLKTSDNESKIKRSGMKNTTFNEKRLQEIEVKPSLSSKPSGFKIRAAEPSVCTTDASSSVSHADTVGIKKEDTVIKASANVLTLKKYNQNKKSTFPPLEIPSSYDCLGPGPVAPLATGKKYMGAHISAAGGIHNVFDNASAINAKSFAMFMRSQRQWAAKPFDLKHVLLFKERAKGFPMHLILPHGSYLMNVGSSNPELLSKSRRLLIEELGRCRQLGIPHFNFHPGSCVGGNSREECCRIIAESINEAHANVPDVIVVLENMCKQGNTIGGDFHELRRIIELVTDRSRVGVCLDTCHAHNAGYDLSTEEGFQTMLNDFEKIVGFQFLRGLHINDSMNAAGSHVDRHECIGRGHIGIAGMKRFMNCPHFNDMPLILETPYSSDAGYAREIKLLEGMIDVSSSKKVKGKVVTRAVSVKSEVTCEENDNKSDVKQFMLNATLNSAKKSKRKAKKNETVSTSKKIRVSKDREANRNVVTVKSEIVRHEGIDECVNSDFTTNDEKKLTKIKRITSKQGLVKIHDVRTPLVVGGHPCETASKLPTCGEGETNLKSKPGLQIKNASTGAGGFLRNSSKCLQQTKHSLRGSFNNKTPMRRRGPPSKVCEESQDSKSQSCHATLGSSKQTRSSSTSKRSLRN